MRCLYTMVYMENRFLRARVHLPNDTVVLVPSGVAPSLYRSAGICADPFAEWEKRPLDQINKVAFYIYCGPIARLSVYRLFPLLSVCVCWIYNTGGNETAIHSSPSEKQKKSCESSTSNYNPWRLFFHFSLFSVLINIPIDLLSVLLNGQLFNETPPPFSAVENIRERESTFIL